MDCRGGLRVWFANFADADADLCYWFLRLRLVFFFSFVLLFWDCFYGFKQHVWEKVKVTKKLHLAEEGKAEAAKKRVGEFREYIIYVKEK